MSVKISTFEKCGHTRILNLPDSHGPAKERLVLDQWCGTCARNGKMNSLTNEELSDAHVIGIPKEMSQVMKQSTGFRYRKNFHDKDQGAKAPSFFQPKYALSTPKKGKGLTVNFKEAIAVVVGTGAGGLEMHEETPLPQRFVDDALDRRPRSKLQWAVLDRSDQEFFKKRYHIHKSSLKRIAHTVVWVLSLPSDGFEPIIEADVLEVEFERMLNDESKITELRAMLHDILGPHYESLAARGGSPVDTLTKRRPARAMTTYWLPLKVESPRVHIPENHPFSFEPIQSEELRARGLLGPARPRESPSGQQAVRLPLLYASRHAILPNVFPRDMSLQDAIRQADPLGLLTMTPAGPPLRHTQNASSNHQNHPVGQHRRVAACFQAGRPEMPTPQSPSAEARAGNSLAHVARDSLRVPLDRLAAFRLRQEAEIADPTRNWPPNTVAFARARRQRPARQDIEPSVSSFQSADIEWPPSNTAGGSLDSGRPERFGRRS